MSRRAQLSDHELSVLEGAFWLHGPSRDVLSSHPSLSKTRANAVLAASETAQDACVAGDNTAFGEKPAEFMVKQFGGQGNIVARRGIAPRSRTSA